VFELWRRNPRRLDDSPAGLEDASTSLQ